MSASFLRKYKSLHCLRASGLRISARISGVESNDRTAIQSPNRMDQDSFSALRV